jgi:hypothetical protein
MFGSMIIGPLYMKNMKKNISLSRIKKSLLTTRNWNH